MRTVLGQSCMGWRVGVNFVPLILMQLQFGPAGVLVSYYINNNYLFSKNSEEFRRDSKTSSNKPW